MHCRLILQYWNHALKDSMAGFTGSLIFDPWPELYYEVTAHVFFYVRWYHLLHQTVKAT